MMDALSGKGAGGPEASKRDRSPNGTADPASASNSKGGRRIDDVEPTIRPGRPKEAAAAPSSKPRGGNIGVGPKANAAAAPRNPFLFWEEFYKKNDELPGALLEKVAAFRKEGQILDAEAALRGYLRFRAAHAEPWMYEMLAVSIEKRKGSPDEVKTYLGYAAFQANQIKNPNQILSVADMLVLRGIFEKVGPPNGQVTAGEMVDRVAQLVPHRIEPLLMSVNIATKTKDPKRMGDALTALLSLGWPDNDELIRREARKQVDALAKVLREDGRGPEADALLARMPEAFARDLYVRLSWDGVDDIDLIVDEPLGASAQLYKNPRTIFGGAIVTNGYGKHPEEVYVCPRGFTGTYTIRVDKVYQPTSAAKDATIEVITHEGTPAETHEIHKVDLAHPGPIVVRLDDGRRTDVMPFTPAPIAPPSLAPDASKPAPARAAPRR